MLAELEFAMSKNSKKKPVEVYKAGIEAISRLVPKGKAKELHPNVAEMSASLQPVAKKKPAKKSAKKPKYTASEIPRFVPIGGNSGRF